jgi:hypothetical protein
MRLLFYEPKSVRWLHKIEVSLYIIQVTKMKSKPWIFVNKVRVNSFLKSILNIQFCDKMNEILEARARLWVIKSQKIESDKFLMQGMSILTTKQPKTGPFHSGDVSWIVVSCMMYQLKRASPESNVIRTFGAISGGEFKYTSLVSFFFKNSYKNGMYRAQKFYMNFTRTTLPAISLAPPELSYRIFYMLNKTSTSINKLYIF